MVGAWHGRSMAWLEHGMVGAWHGRSMA
jgi:hypothetical protein